VKLAGRPNVTILRARWEAHDDGYVEHADRHDVGHGSYLASSFRIFGIGDSSDDKVPTLVIVRQPPPLLWLLGLRVYLAVILFGNCSGKAFICRSIRFGPKGP
jgi:hypothetical protein